MPVRKYRRETSEISGCLKYLIFIVNVVFWVNITCQILRSLQVYNILKLVDNWCFSTYIRSMGLDRERCFQQFF